MHTKGVYRATKALAALGCAVLRFNFRGVGRSEGMFDNGVGELEDFRAALDAMARFYPDTDAWAAGFSFGAWVALTAGALDDRVTRLIAIAPALHMYDFTALRASDKPKYFVQGALDEICPLPNLEAFYAELRPPKRLAIVPGANHLFNGQVEQMSSALADLIEQDLQGEPEVRKRDAAMTDAVIVAAARTPVGKAPGGTLRTTRPDELAAIVLREVLARAPGISPGDVDDVIIGCAMPEAEQGMNVARLASLRAGVPVTASAVTVNRFCASGLQAIAYAAERVMAGSADVILAGGTESMSMVPLGGHKVAPNPALVETHPDVYLSTGLVAENHAREFEHLAAGAGRILAAEPPARDCGNRRRTFQRRDRCRADPLRRGETTARTRGGRTRLRRRRRSAPGYVARGVEKLRPAFHAAGTVTAGNSSQMSDGAAAVLVRLRSAPKQPVCSRSPASSATRLRASSPSGSGSDPCRQSTASFRVQGSHSTTSIRSSSTKHSPLRRSHACASCPSIPTG